MTMIIGVGLRMIDGRFSCFIIANEAYTCMRDDGLGRSACREIYSIRNEYIHIGCLQKIDILYNTSESYEPHLLFCAYWGCLMA